MRSTLVTVDPQDNRIVKLSADATKLVEITRLERDLRGAGSVGAAPLEEILPSLEQIAAGFRDLQVLQAVSALPDRTRAYGVDEIAELAGCDVESVRRALVWMLQEGLAGPDRGGP